MVAAAAPGAGGPVARNAAGAYLVGRRDPVLGRAHKPRRLEVGLQPKKGRAKRRLGAAREPRGGLGESLAQQSSVLSRSHCVR